MPYFVGKSTKILGLRIEKINNLYLKRDKFSHCSGLKPHCNESHNKAEALFIATIHCFSALAKSNNDGKFTPFAV